MKLVGRIRLETGGGAWCPGRRLDADVVEYLQVDLGQLNVITHVETQGRFGNGQVSSQLVQYRCFIGLALYYKCVAKPSV